MNMAEKGRLMGISSRHGNFVGILGVDTESMDIVKLQESFNLVSPSDLGRAIIESSDKYYMMESMKQYKERVKRSKESNIPGFYPDREEYLIIASKLTSMIDEISKEMQDTPYEIDLKNGDKMKVSGMELRHSKPDEMTEEDFHSHILIEHNGEVIADFWDVVATIGEKEENGTQIDLFKNISYNAEKINTLYDAFLEGFEIRPEEKKPLVSAMSPEESDTVIDDFPRP